MDPEKKNKVRDIMETISKTQMELGWACGEKNRLLLDNLHYVLDVLETHKEAGKTKDKMKG